MLHIPAHNLSTSAKVRTRKLRTIDSMDADARWLWNYRREAKTPESLTPDERIRMQDLMMEDYLRKLPN